MSKQIIYCNFIPRIFASTIDLSLINLFINPIISFTSTFIFYFIFRDFLAAKSISYTDTKAMFEIVTSEEFMRAVSAVQFMSYFILIYVIYFIVIGLYFLFFWNKFNATPGKMLLRMKLVDADNFQKLSLTQMLKRLFGYFTAPVGIWFMFFTNNNRMLHDLFANSVVIKS